jgi:WhiB family redox-sensing transcriptional regulator
MRRDVSWMIDAACRESSVDRFYPEQPHFEEARAICRRCRVIDECLEHALAVPERYGVWGGRSPLERVELRRARVRPPQQL